MVNVVVMCSLLLQSNAVFSGIVVDSSITICIAPGAENVRIDRNYFPGQAATKPTERKQ